MYIDLRPTINIQGTHKVFCLDTVRVINRRRIITMVAPYRLTRKVNDWCDNSKREKYGSNLELLNINKEPFNWVNE